MGFYLLSASVTSDSWRNELRKVRKDKGVTQQEAARLTGIRQPRISQIENGEVDPRLSEVMSLSETLGMVLAMFPSGFLESVEYTIKDCLVIDERKNGPRTVPEKILGDRMYL